MALRFPPQFGTNGDDNLLGGQDEVTFGLRGDDVITSQRFTDFNIQLGGPGNDTYRLADNAATTIVDTGGADTLIADGIGLNRDTTFAATFDGTLIAGDTASGQQISIVDWLAPGSGIEQIRLQDGTFNIDEIQANLGGPNFLGEVSLDELIGEGLLPAGTTKQGLDADLAYLKGREQEQIDALTDRPSSPVTLATAFVGNSATLDDVVGFGAGDVSQVKLFSFADGAFIGPPSADGDGSVGFFSADAMGDVALGSGRHFIKTFTSGEGTSDWRQFNISESSSGQTSLLGVTDTSVPADEVVSLDTILDTSALADSAQVQVFYQGQNFGFMTQDELGNETITMPSDGASADLWVNQFLSGNGRSGWGRTELKATEGETIELVGGAEAMAVDDALTQG